MAQENLNSPKQDAAPAVSASVVDERAAEDEGEGFTKPLLKGTVEAVVVDAKFESRSPPNISEKKVPAKDGSKRFQEKQTLKIWLAFPKGTIATNTNADLHGQELWTTFGVYADNVDEKGVVLAGKKLSRWAGDKSGAKELLGKCREFSGDEKLGVSKIPETLKGRTVLVKTGMVNIPGGTEQTSKFVITAIVK